MTSEAICRRSSESSGPISVRNRALSVEASVARSPIRRAIARAWLGERGALLQPVGEVQLGRQPAQHARVELAVLVAEHLARLAEQRDEPVVDAAELEAAQARAVAERGARQALGRVDPAREVGGAQERLAGGAGRARARLGDAEPEQQLAAARHVGALLQRVGLQRSLEVRRRLLVGEEPERTLAGSHGVLDRLLQLAHRRGDEEVMGKLGEMRLGIGAVEILERQADLAVQQAAALRAEVVVERVSDEPVREAVDAQRRGALDEHARADRGAQGGVQLGGVAVADALQGVEAKLAPDDRRRAQQLACGLGKRLEAVANRLAHAVGNPHGGDVGGVVEASLGAEQAHDLVDEERVALGRLVDRAHDAIGRAAARDALDDRGDVGLAQPAQRQPLTVADDVAQRRRQLCVQSGLGLAIGADHEDRGVAHVDGEEAEQQQRRMIGAVQVVEDEDERRLTGRGAQQRRDRVEELKARRVRFPAIGCGRLARRIDALLGRLREAGDQAREPVGRLGSERGERLAEVALGGQPAQDPQPRPVRRRAAAAPRAAPQHRRSGRDGLGADRVGHRGLADARVTGDHEQPPAAGQRSLQPLT